jgi:hypothetical protein
MKIHIRPFPPILPAPPPKPPPAAFQLAMETEELSQIAQQQQTRQKKLFGTRRNRRDLNEDTDLEEKRNRRPNRNLDFLA